MVGRGHWRVALLAMLLLWIGATATGSEGASIWRQRAETLTAQKAYGAAIQAYLSAARWCPGDPLPYLRAGRIYILQRRFSLAEEALWHAYLLSTRNVESLFALGDLAAAQGMNGQAIFWYQKARELAPERADIALALGEASLAESDFSAAEDAFRAAITAAKLRQAHYQLGLLLADRYPAESMEHLQTVAGQGDSIALEAEAMMEAVAQINQVGDAAERADLLGLTYVRQKAWTLARAQLSQAVALSPDNAEAHAYLGYTLYQLGEYGAAEKSLKQALALNPVNAQTYHFLAMLYRHFGWPHSALEMLAKAYELDPDSPAIAAEIAQAYADAGAYAEAETWFEQAAQLTPTLASYTLLQATFHIHHLYHVRGKGIPAAERAIALQPGEAAAYDLLGRGLFLTGDRSRAEAALRQALALDPDLASAHYYLAKLQARRGEIKAAEQSYQRAIDLDVTGQIRARAGDELEQLRARRSPGSQTNAPQ